MMEAVHTAATELADVLEHENAALLRLDLPGVMALLSSKRTALAAFQSAACEDKKVIEGNTPMRALAIRLQDAATENKRLLERAMAAQQHIMSLLAQAARQASSSKLYGSLGSYVGRAEGAFALSARA